MQTYTVDLFIHNEDIRTNGYTEVRDPGRLTEIVGYVSKGEVSHVEKAVKSAQDAFLSWREVALEERSHLLLQAADLLENDGSELASLLTRESGMLFNISKNEIIGAAEMMRDTAKEALSFLLPEQYEDEFSWLIVEKVPIGVVAALTPWNVPIGITMSKIAPILVTGNTVIIKPSPSASLAVSIALKKIAEVFPPGVINIVHGDTDVGVALTTHPLVRKISLTGGIETAKRVMQSAADTLKQLHFELGGNDAAIILDDANLKTVIPKIADGALRRTGQVCVAAKRIYIPQSMYKDACDLFLEYISTFKIGHGLDSQTTLGPMNNQNQYEYVKDLIVKTKQSSAHVHELGEVLEPENWRNGYYLHPVVVTYPKPEQEIVVLEQFGPVVPLVAYQSESEVLGLVNHSEYGLGSTVWTEDFQRGVRISRKIEAGMTGVNGFMDNTLARKHLPFGGIKQSGIGWERGKAGLKEYVNYHGITYHKNG